MTTFNGTSDADIFAFSHRPIGTNSISAFEIGKDRIDLSALHVADLDTLKPFMTQSGPDVVIELGFSSSAERITLSDTSLTALLASPASFIFNAASDALIVEGTFGRDVLFGGNGADRLYGFKADDSLNAGASEDLLVGGRGDDALRGGAGNDVFLYDERNFDRDTVLDFKIGKDKIDLSALHVADIATLQPFMTQNGQDVVIELGFASSAERITLAATSLTALLASPASFVFNAASDALIVEGTFGNDVLFGGKGADRLYGFKANDSLNAGAGQDLLVGGAGDDTLRGGAGNDVFLYDERGVDRDTVMDFRIGKDKIDLSALHVADLATLRPFMVQSGHDVVIDLGFASSAERITLAHTNLSKLLAVPASFIFNAAPDALTVEGTFGRDVLFGGNGTDRLYGFKANDSLNGGAGRDILIGGAGDDTLRGGAGKDIFQYDAGDGHDTILDFSRAQNDRIDLRNIDPSTADGDQKLVFVTGHFTARGQVLVETVAGVSTVSVNLDDNLTNAELTIDVHSARAITAVDLLL